MGFSTSLCKLINRVSALILHRKQRRKQAQAKLQATLQARKFKRSTVRERAYRKQQALYKRYEAQLDAYVNEYSINKLTKIIDAPVNTINRFRQQKRLYGKHSKHLINALKELQPQAQEQEQASPQPQPQPKPKPESSATVGYKRAIKEAQARYQAIKPYLDSLYATHGNDWHKVAGALKLPSATVYKAVRTGRLSRDLEGRMLASLDALTSTPATSTPATSTSESSTSTKE